MSGKSDKCPEKATYVRKKRHMSGKSDIWTEKIDNGKKIFKNRKMFTDLNEI
jgi:hypothetical protein